MSYQQVIDGQVNPEVPINENMAALGQAYLWSHDVTHDTGLTVGLNGGDLDGNAVADATLACTNNATNYIVANRSTRALSVATGTTNWNNTATYGRIARAVFASSVLTYHDERSSSGGIFDHAAGLGSGDVVGPGSAVSGHLAVFSGTTGKVIADGGAPPTGTNTGDETAASIAAIDHGVSTKATPVDADEMNLLDSAASFVLKRFTLTNFKAFLKTYFDTLYTVSGSAGDVSGPGSSVNNHVAVFSGTTGKVIADSGLTLSGTNTGDQTSVTGNAGTATALQTARTIGGTSFDGTANITQPFDAAGFYPGIPTASAKVLRIPIARAVTFAANFAGSYFSASANAAATTVFDVQKNGASIGSVSIASGSTTATFTTTSGTSKSFAAGDVLSIIAPATPDVTLADPGFALAGTR